MEKLFKLSIFWSLIIAIYSCKPEEEKITRDSSVKLQFSTDTVEFDTVFTARKTITNRLKIYNPSKNAVEISTIKLAGMNNSPFNLFINGIDKQMQNDLVLRGKDSLLILVHANINPLDKSLPYLIKDSINFRINSNEQKVIITAWGQDAIYHKNDSISSSVTWEKGKPHVIFKTFNIKKGAILNMKPGTRIFFGGNGKLVVNGQIDAKGTAEDSITFCGIRLEKRFENVPGQWKGITINPVSKSNDFRHVIIKNAETGISIEGKPGNYSNLDFHQSQIKNMRGSGIKSRYADITVQNSLITNCGLYGIEGTIGNYQLWNCTIANYNIDFQRENAGLYFTDFTFNNKGKKEEGPLSLDIVNNIIWGSLDKEFSLNLESEGNLKNFLLQKNLIKTYEKNYKNATGDNFLINEDTLFNVSNYPGFKNYRNYNFKLDSLSPAIDKGKDLTDITEDIEGNLRTDTLDLGSYEYIP